VLANRETQRDHNRYRPPLHALIAAGFVEGKNVRIEERWARGDYAALPALAAELVSMGVAAIAATGDLLRRAPRNARAVQCLWFSRLAVIRFALG